MRLQLMVYQFYLPHQIRDWISIYKLNMNLLALVSKVFFFLSPQTRHFTDKNVFRLLEEKAERKPLKAGLDVRCC